MSDDKKKLTEFNKRELSILAAFSLIEMFETVHSTTEDYLAEIGEQLGFELSAKDFWEICDEVVAEGYAGSGNYKDFRDKVGKFLKKHGAPACVGCLSIAEEQAASLKKCGAFVGGGDE